TRRVSPRGDGCCDSPRQRGSDRRTGRGHAIAEVKAAARATALWWARSKRSLVQTSQSRRTVIKLSAFRASAGRHGFGVTAGAQHCSGELSRWLAVADCLGAIHEYEFDAYRRGSQSKAVAGEIEFAPRVGAVDGAEVEDDDVGECTFG